MDKDNDSNLEKLKVKHPFTVPDGYFAELPAIIQSRVVQKTSRNPVWVFLTSRVMKLGYAVAIVIVAVFFGNKMAHSDLNGNEEHYLATVSDAQLVAYLMEEDIEQDQITALLSDFEATSEEVFYPNESELKAGEIEQYLESEYDDV